MAKYTLLKNRITGQRAIRNNITRELIQEADNPQLYKELRARAIKSRNIRERENFFKDIGLVKVKSISGKIYWE